jgi:uncharacterized protein (DUF2141 family)
MKIKKSILALLFVFGTYFAQSQDLGELKIIIIGFEQITGTVKLSLYNAESTYMAESFMSASKKVENEETVIYFKDVPFGSYTFSLYHDSNGNNRMDKNMLGIPTEDYAFSNNADGRFGPPSYEKCVFEVNKSSIVQTIKLN